jgi:hypothetical protein
MTQSSLVGVGDVWEPPIPPIKPSPLRWIHHFGGIGRGNDNGDVAGGQSNTKSTVSSSMTPIAMSSTTTNNTWQHRRKTSSASTTGPHYRHHHHHHHHHQVSVSLTIIGLLFLLTCLHRPIQQSSALFTCSCNCPNGVCDFTRCASCVQVQTACYCSTGCPPSSGVSTLASRHYLTSYHN